MMKKTKLFFENDVMEGYPHYVIIAKALNMVCEENQQLIKMLDNVANYMQKQHKDMPIDDFVEWWNNIATGGL